MRDCDLSIVIPVYNSTASLEEIVSRCEKVFEDYRLSFEIIFVNDASPNPQVSSIIRELVNRYTFIRGFDLLKNAGQFNATICGMSYAVGKYIVTMDDDLQHCPEDIIVLYQYICHHSEVDVVVGIGKEKKHSLVRNIGSCLINRLDVYMLGKPADFQSGSFRIMRKEFADILLACKGHNPILGPLIIKNTKRLVNVVVEHRERNEGKSGYNLVKIIRTTRDNVIGYSSLPLRILGIVGVITFISSIIYSLFVILQKLLYQITVPGYASIVILVSFMGGMLMLGMGIIGEYLIKILNNTNDYPSYIEREIN